MSTIFDDDILIHLIAAPGLPGNGFTAPEALALRNDIDTLLSRPVITELNDVPDIDATAPANGQTLIYDAATDTWKPGASGGTIDGVSTRENNAWQRVGWSISKLYFWKGVRATASSDPTTVIIDVVFGGTGVADSAARSDHTHSLPFISRPSITPQAYMSGGTRTLLTTGVTISVGRAAKIEAKLRFQIRGGDTGASYYTLNLDIGGDVHSSGSGVNGLWCVQGVPKETELTHDLTVTGTGANIPISGSVSWTGGGGFYTDAGELEIKITYSD